MLLELQKESKFLKEKLSNSKNFYEVKGIDKLWPGDIIITNGV